MDFVQISTVLNKIVADVTGQNPVPGSFRDTKDFVAAADMALSVGTDPIMNSITQMIGRTVISSRPYEPATALVEMDALRYGNAVRKITPIFTSGAADQPMFDSQPADGQSTDQYTIKRPKAIETRFANFAQWHVQAPTVFVDQLRSAFRGPEELDEFMTAQLTEVNNEVNSEKEALAHGTICNMIAGKALRESANILHVLTAYNTATGQSIDSAATLFSPTYFEGFVKWFFAFVADISDMMSKRSVAYHEAITGYTIMRHTPKRDQRLLVYSFLLNAIKTMALSGIYNDNLLTMDVTAPIEYWLSMNDRMGIKVDASYTKADGTVDHGGVTMSNVIAVLYDRDAMGCNINLESVDVTPRNAKGRYYNTYYHFARRYYNDLTENCVVFVLD